MGLFENILSYLEKYIYGERNTKETIEINNNNIKDIIETKDIIDTIDVNDKNIKNTNTIKNTKEIKEINTNEIKNTKEINETTTIETTEIIYGTIGYSIFKNSNNKVIVSYVEIKFHKLIF